MTTIVTKCASKECRLQRSPARVGHGRWSRSRLGTEGGHWGRWWSWGVPRPRQEVVFKTSIVSSGFFLSVTQPFNAVSGRAVWQTGLTAMASLSTSVSAKPSNAKMTPRARAASITITSSPDVATSVMTSSAITSSVTTTSSTTTTRSASMTSSVITLSCSVHPWWFRYEH